MKIYNTQLAIAIFAILISGCERKAETLESGAIKVGGIVGNATIQIITLEEGTMCAVLVGAQKAALDCNWK
jgi:hypothetical protein